MTEIEKVEKLRENANVTFAEAKEALDNSGNDILDALIYLENSGKARVPEGGGFYSGTDLPVPAEPAVSGDNAAGTKNTGSGEEFVDLMKRFGAFCLKMFNKGLNNYLEATKGDQLLFSCPVLIVILLAVFFFWITTVLFVISLFFGFRYRFSGDDLGKDSINSVMENASGVVDEVKKSVSESMHKNDNKDNKQE